MKIQMWKNKWKLGKQNAPDCDDCNSLRERETETYVERQIRTHIHFLAQYKINDNICKTSVIFFTIVLESGLERLIDRVELVNVYLFCESQKYTYIYV